MLSRRLLPRATDIAVVAGLASTGLTRDVDAARDGTGRRAANRMPVTPGKTLKDWAGRARNGPK
jgi:hypothetical protein